MCESHVPPCNNMLSTVSRDQHVRANQPLIPISCCTRANKSSSYLLVRSTLLNSFQHQYQCHRSCSGQHIKGFIHHIVTCCCVYWAICLSSSQDTASINCIALHTVVQSCLELYTLLVVSYGVWCDFRSWWKSIYRYTRNGMEHCTFLKQKAAINSYAYPRCTRMQHEYKDEDLHLQKPIKYNIIWLSHLINYYALIIHNLLYIYCIYI